MLLKDSRLQEEKHVFLKLQLIKQTKYIKQFKLQKSNLRKNKKKTLKAIQKKLWKIKTTKVYMNQV